MPCRRAGGAADGGPAAGATLRVAIRGGRRTREPAPAGVVANATAAETDVRHLLFITILLAAALSAGAAPAQEDPAPYAYDVDALNRGLAPAEPPLRLDTPRAALASFLEAIRQDQLARAAHALNMNAIPVDRQAERAGELAMRLAFVLRRHQLIDWAAVPDRPDARVVPGLAERSSPYRRRTVELGEVETGDAPVVISLQRFRAGDAEPVWLFAPFAVSRIDAMYAFDRPDLLRTWMPLRQRLDTLGRPSLYEWGAATALLAAAGLLGAVLYGAVRLVARAVPVRWAHPARKVALPLAVAAGAAAFHAGTGRLFALTGPVASQLFIVAEVVALAGVAWLLMQSVSGATRALSQRYVVPLGIDDRRNRRTKTMFDITSRLTLVAIALVCIGYILMRADLFASFGVSMLASVGALGVIVAIAARPLLGNMVAGLQLALTDPLRIGDVVVYDGHWSVVEDITFAHTVLHTWTDTRLIVPHTDILSRPFENWSKGGEAVRRIVRLAVDPRIDVDEVRREVERIVDGDERATAPPSVEVVDVSGDVVVLWVWISGTGSASSWALHNEVKERLLVFLKDLDGGAYLPRRRQVLIDGDGRAGRSGEAAGDGTGADGGTEPGPAAGQQSE